MNLNLILEVVISLAALFWLLSMASSFFVEAVNSMLRNLRADVLERFVCEMIIGEGGVGAAVQRLGWWNWRGRLSASLQADPLGLLSHGAVLSLRKPKFGPGSAPTSPSYIPADVFARALLDRLATVAAAAGIGVSGARDLMDALGGPASPLAAAQRAPFALAAQGADPALDLLRLLRSLSDELSSRTPVDAASHLRALAVGFGSAQVPTAALPAQQHLGQVLEAAAAVLDAMKAQEPLGQQLQPSALWLLLMREAGKQMVAVNAVDAARVLVKHALLPPSLREALRPIVAEADFDADKLRKGIEHWYDAVMERASGWFKRHTTLWLGVCGLLLAIALNVNPFRIAGDLSRDAPLRAAGVAFAEQVVQGGGDAALVQQFVFNQAAQRQRWPERIVALPERARSAPEQARAELAVLAAQMRPLLVRSAHYAGLLPTLAVAPQSPVDDAARDELTRQVCRAWLRSKPPVAADADALRAADAALSDAALLDHADCKSIRGELSGAKTWGEAARAFWASTLHAWDAPLAAALHDALTAPDTSTALPALRAAFDSARGAAQATSQRADAFLSRIPSLGWPDREAGRSYLETLWDRVTFFGSLGALAGWMLTALMVSFGAPFWFDLLSKLINRRLTGPKPVGG